MIPSSRTPSATLEIRHLLAGTLLEVWQLPHRDGTLRLGGEIEATLRSGEATVLAPAPWTPRVQSAEGILSTTPDRTCSDGSGRVAIPLPEGATLTLTHGDAVFEARWVTAERARRPRLLVLARRALIQDALLLGLLALFSFLGAILGLLVALVPGDPDGSASVLDDRFATLILARKPAEISPKLPTREVHAEGGPAKRSTPAEARASREPAASSTAKAVSDRQIAEQAGVLGAFGDPGGLSGFGGEIDGDLLAQIGSNGRPGGPVVAGFGLGPRGTGPGGTAEGIGPVGGTSGLCEDGCDGRFASFGSKTEGRLLPPDQPMTVIGQLDKRYIQETIQRHLNAIRYCYQRQLPRDPNLAGKVVMKFTIAQDGSVSQASAAQSSLGSAAVEECLVGRFLHMRFPERTSSGIVVVRYPFLFSPG